MRTRIVIIIASFDARGDALRSDLVPPRPAAVRATMVHAARRYPALAPYTLHAAWVRVRGSPLGRDKPSPSPSTLTLTLTSTLTLTLTLTLTGSAA